MIGPRRRGVTSRSQRRLRPFPARQPYPLVVGATETGADGQGSVAAPEPGAVVVGPHRWVSAVHDCPVQYRYWPAVQGSAYQPRGQPSPARTATTTDQRGLEMRVSSVIEVDGPRCGEILAITSGSGARWMSGTQRAQPCVGGSPVKGPITSNEVAALVMCFGDEIAVTANAAFHAFSSSLVAWVRRMKIRLRGPGRVPTVDCLAQARRARSWGTSAAGCRSRSASIHDPRREVLTGVVAMKRRAGRAASSRRSRSSPTD